MMHILFCRHNLKLFEDKKYSLLNNIFKKDKNKFKIIMVMLTLEFFSSGFVFDEFHRKTG